MSLNPNLKPPIPRNKGAPTLSELIPFKSNKIDIRKSKLLYPLLAIGLTVIVLFETRGQPYIFIGTIGVVATLGLFMSVYIYSGIQKAWWLYIAPAAISWVTSFDAVFALYAFVFRDILPGGNVGEAVKEPASIANFLSAFFGAGMCEEMVKATPVLLALALTFWLGGVPAEPPVTLADTAARRTNGMTWLKSLALRGPLDGMLMGFVAGAVFILSETLGEYVPREVKSHLAAGQGEGIAYYLGLTMALPRVFQGVSGHMGWAAIFGYFIGLAAKYPTRWVRLVAIGYLTAAILHGCWDTNVMVPIPPSWGIEATAPWQTFLTIVTVLILVACLLKAKQLEQAWGSVSASNGSILVGGAEPKVFSPGNATAADVVAATPSPSWKVGGPLSGLQKLANTLEAVAGGFVKPVAAPPTAAMADSKPQMHAAAAQAERFSIGTTNARYGLELGHQVDFGQLFGVPKAVADVTTHPTDKTVLGLRNVGPGAWTTITAEGATLTVPPGKNLRVAAGTRLLFGTAVIDIARY